MNMVIMCQVHHISTEIEVENIEVVTKSTPRDTNQAYPII